MKNLFLALVMAVASMAVSYSVRAQGIATMYQEIHSQDPHVRQRVKQDMKLENQRINAEATKREAEKQKLEQEKYDRKHHKHMTSNSVKNTKH